MEPAEPFERNRIIPRSEIAIERAAPSVPHLPPLRALQLCRRRPTLDVAASVTAGIRKPLQLETKSIVEAIETHHRDRLEEQIERLAHHAAKGELQEKAVQYLRMAGLRAD